MRRLIKYISFFIIGFVALVCFSVIFTQTRIFKNRLRDFIVEKANLNLNGELQIKRIDGNLFSNLEITGILLKSDLDTVIYVPKFSLKLTPTRILRKEVLVNSILIDSPYLKLQQLTDSTWNFTNLIKSGSEKPPDTTSTSQPFNYLISLIDFHLKDTQINISAHETIIPKKVKKFNVRLSAIYSDRSQELLLKEFRLQTEQPAFDLREISFFIAGKESEISLQNFVIRTAQNRINGEGEYFISDTLTSEGGLKSEPIDFSEFQVFIPGLRLYGNPKFSINTDFTNDSLNFDIDISEQNQRLFLKTRIANVSKAFNKTSREQLRYALEGNIRNLDVAHWSANPEMDYIINGDFLLKGRGAIAEAAELTLDANFSDCIFLQRPVSEINLKAEYSKGDLNSHLGIFGDFGKLFLKAYVFDISDSQHFNIQADLQQLNAAKLILNDSLQTNINLTLLAEGNSFDPQKMRGNLQLKLAPSILFNTAIDNFFSTIQFAGESYSIDTLHLDSKFAQLNLTGKTSLISETKLRFDLQLGDLMALNHFIHADTIRAAGLVSGHLTGKPDSLYLDTEFKLNNIIFNAISADSIIGDLHVFRDAARGEGCGSVRIRNTGTPDLSIDAINIQTEFTQQAADIFIDISHRDSINARVQTQVVLDSVPRIIFPNIALDFKNQRWSGGSPDMQFILEKDAYQVQNFRLTAPADSSDTLQIISANGTISLSGDENLQLQISGIDIGALPALFKIPVQVAGSFFLNVHLQGTAEKPIITGSTGIGKGSINQFDYKKFNGYFEYADKCLTLNFTLFPTNYDSLMIDGYLPINLSLAEQGNMFCNDKQLEITLKSDGISLDAIQAGSDQIEEVQGEIVCDLNIRNTINDPQLNGFFGIKDGAFKIKKIGVDYTDFQLRISVDSTRLSIDTLRAKRGDGFLTASGYLDFDSTLVAGIIKNIYLDFRANKIFLVRSRDFEVQISGDARLNGSTESPQFSGTINVLRSRFYIPALMAESDAAPKDDQSAPLLVAATRKTGDQLISLKKKPRKPGPEHESPDLYNNLKGTIKVSIPKNTWLKSPEMLMEIGGDLDLVKNGPDFEIFGTISIVRGHYDLFGKRFDILEGNLTFQGGAEFNPVIRLEAEYKFRTAAREKKILKLSVTDKALTPTLKFSMDDTEIVEGDAASYIMFGKSLAELTYGQKSDVADDGDSNFDEGTLAKMLAANLVSNQLAKTIGKELNLDFIEINAKSDWQSASFVVGKYLTNDLFMSYEQGFGDSNDDDGSTKSITLEYELTRFLFLQLLQEDEKTSGVDVIFKFERR